MTSIALIGILFIVGVVAVLLILAVVFLLLSGRDANQQDKQRPD